MRFEKLEILPVKTKPKVTFLPEEGQMEIQGESYPENSVEFYEPLIVWLNGYFAEYTKRDIQFNFRLHYFNTSSSKAIMDIMDLLDSHYQKGWDITINWFHEEDDEDIQESGEEFSEGLKVPFKIIPF